MENSGNDSHENHGEVPKTTDRRKVLTIGGLAAGATLVALARRLGSHGAPPPEKTQPEEVKNLPTVTTSPEQRVPPTELTPAPEWNEKIDELTSEYLFKIYKDRMSEAAFKTDDEKKDFMNKITQVATRLNPNNPNLANQLAAIMYYNTKGSFNPSYQDLNNGSVGLFHLSPEYLKEIGYTTESFMEVASSSQLSLLATFLESAGRKISPDGSFTYDDLSDLVLANIRPELMNRSSDQIVFTKGSSDEYNLYQEYDLDGDGVISSAEIALTILKSGVEDEQYLNIGVHDKEPTIFDEPDRDTSDETEADEKTAEWLVSKYSTHMTSNSFTGDTSDETEAKKLSFMQELTRTAKRLNPDNPNLANQIAAVINFESDGTFSSWDQNKGSKATGLIQFMSSTAKEFGTTLYSLQRMSSINQLSYVELYLKARQEEAVARGQDKLWDLSDVYMAVLWPDAVGREPDHVLFSKGSKDYAQNEGLDKNGDGQVTKSEAAWRVEDAATNRGESIDYLKSPRPQDKKNA